MMRGRFLTSSVRPPIYRWWRTRSCICAPEEISKSLLADVMTASLDMREKISMELAVPPLEMALPLPTRKSGPPATPKLFCSADEVSAETGVIDIGRQVCLTLGDSSNGTDGLCAESAADRGHRRRHPTNSSANDSTSKSTRAAASGCGR